MWCTLQPLEFHSADGTVIKIPQYFETDFASVPTALTNVFPRWGKYGRASVVHDEMYWSRPVDRDHADRLFLEAMTISDVPWLTRWSLYLAVKNFGEFAWNDNERLGAEGFSRIWVPGSGTNVNWSRPPRDSIGHGP